MTLNDPLSLLPVWSRHFTSVCRDPIPPAIDSLTVSQISSSWSVIVSYVHLCFVYSLYLSALVIVIRRDLFAIVYFISVSV